MPTENVILDPESFKFYLKRQNKIRIEKIKIIKKRNNTPGNGKIWKNKQTIIQEFKFETNKLNRNKRQCNHPPFLPVCKSKQHLMRKTNSFTVIINSIINKEYDTDITQFMKAKEKLHSELLEFKL